MSDVSSERLVLLKVYVPADIHNAVVDTAEADDRSASAWVRRMIVERLAESR